MELELHFYNLPPMPTNRAKALVIVKGRPMYIKTPLAREFEKDLMNRLLKFSNNISEFVSNFDKKIHFISAKYSFYTEYQTLFTKDGCISNRAGDLDSHKLFQDTLFSFMGLDDKLIRDVRYCSYPSLDDKPNVKVIFKLESLCKIKNATLTQSIMEQQNQDLTSFALL